ncbi:DNA topoisomerase IB [Microlunatus parietis]|uniref:DNA topoisomerase IB n=1 Tax=Microlunatus parietis TaxID=682979 RepID=A0A7Y9I3Q2_9ACTN|nr:DNA topoisomerase IB [Microlunatus parietis]NYE69441.1 DNA topoisomerase IB [Microlunatus parietis]
MTRLRRVTDRTKGWRRRRCGRGFSYLDDAGSALADDQVRRCRALAIPPAWTDVWICPDPNGHLQAVGTDSDGRVQYLYHPDWRRRQDEAKFDRILGLAERLPPARRRVVRDLKATGLPRAKALAAAFRLLDRGLFRVGSESYKQRYGSLGLASLGPDQVHLSGATMTFVFPAKSGELAEIEVTDRLAADVVRTLARRRAQRTELLAFKDGRRWHNLTADDINDYLATVIGPDFTAKDFRTWHATVQAGFLLALADPAGTDRRRRTQVLQVIDEVAERLGNTRSIARSAYIHPRLIDLFHEGAVLPPAVVAGLRADAAPPYPLRVERAVVDLLG